MKIRQQVREVTIPFMEKVNAQLKIIENSLNNINEVNIALFKDLEIDQIKFQENELFKEAYEEKKEFYSFLFNTLFELNVNLSDSELKQQLHDSILHMELFHEETLNECQFINEQIEEKQKQLAQRKEVKDVFKNTYEYLNIDLEINMFNLKTKNIHEFCLMLDQVRSSLNQLSNKREFA